MATDIDEPTYESTDTVAGATPDKQPEQSESEKALVRKIQKTIKADKDHHKNAFKRMREDMFMARTGRSPDYLEGNYKVNLAGRHIRQKTAALYAKNPKATARRRETLDFVVWDEDPNSLKMSMEIIQTAQQMMAAASAPQVDPVTGAPVVDPMTGAPPTPPEPPQEMIMAFQKAMSIVDDFKQGMERRQVIEKIGKTMEILFTQAMREQKPVDFKTAMKSGVRRACTTGVCYVELGFQREMGPRPAMMEKLADLRARLDHMRVLTEKIADTENPINSDAAEIAELEHSIASLQAEPEVVLREGLILDFPQSTKVIPHKLTKSLIGFVGARHVTIEYMYTDDEVKEIFGVDLGKKYRGYSAAGETNDKTTQNEENVYSAGKNGSGLVCVWKHYDKAAGLVYYVVDGYDKFLRVPAAPDVFVEDFWPLRALTFNEVEDENCLFPPSDVRLMWDQQIEYNKSRNGMKNHRYAALPRWVGANGSFDDEDAKSLIDMEPFAVKMLNSLGPDTDVKKMLQSLPIPGVDPNLYETSPLFTDMQLAVGMSESQLGLTGKATATGETIAAGATKSADDSSIDDLDGFLSDVARMAGQIMLKEMSEEQVKIIAGPGAVWPQLTLAEIASELFLEVEAGSSGKPNQAVELENWNKMLPFLVQMPGLSSEWVARETVKRLDDKADLTAALSKDAMSILAQNGLAQVSTGDPASDPNAQGGEGAANAPKESTHSPGTGPAFGDNKV
jgi:hypothetical protein